MKGLYVSRCYSALCPTKICAQLRILQCMGCLHPAHSIFDWSTFQTLTSSGIPYPYPIPYCNVPWHLLSLLCPPLHRRQPPPPPPRPLSTPSNPGYHTIPDRCTCICSVSSLGMVKWSMMIFSRSRTGLNLDQTCPYVANRQQLCGTQEPQVPCLKEHCRTP